jgi:branched-chain amino acid transport system ATP-binding protein
VTLLELRDLVVAFGGLRAVDGVSMRVDAGTIVGLIGPNGAGKSTVIDAVTGFVPARSGTIVFDGADITRTSAHRRARRGLTRTFQSLELFEDLTVTENVQVPIGRARSSHDLIGDLGLGAVADEVPSVLSQAERRSLALARALATVPKVVLLDEPAAGLDASGAAALGGRLRALVTDESAILLVDHDMSLVLGVCDYVYVMDTGRLIAEGTPAQVRRDPAVLRSYLGEEVPT